MSLLTACTSGDGLNNDDGAIHLTAITGTVTAQPWGKTARGASRAWTPTSWVGEFSDNGSNPLTQFKCFAFQGSQMVMNGQLVTRTVGSGLQNCTWTDFTQYWSQNGQPMHFYAFAPHDYKTGNVYLDASTPTDWNLTIGSDQRPVLKDFEVNNPPTADLIYAQTRDQYPTTNGGTVDLQFVHALSAIELRIENRHPFLQVAFHGVDLENLQYKADFIFPADGASSPSNQGYWTNWSGERKKLNTNHMDQDNWQTGGHNQGIDGNDGMQVIDPGENRGLLTGASTLFILPQTAERWNRGDAHRAVNGGTKPVVLLMGRVTDTRNGFDLVNDFTMLDDGREKTLIVPLNPNSDGTPYTFEPNKRYIITIVFGGSGDNMGWTADGHEVAVPVGLKVSVQPWTDGDKNWIMGNMNGADEYL